MKVSIKKINITPNKKVSLLGYFNERYSEKILDDLYCRILCIENNSDRAIIIEIDTCIVPLHFANRIRTYAERLHICKKENIMIYATHTHTAPALDDFFFTKAEVWYREWLEKEIQDAITEFKFEEVSYAKAGKINYDNICYNRRWYMKNGWVITNPPRGIKALVKPEGPVDRELSFLIFYNRESEPLTLILNISNHTDTVGQNVISADWPGMLERLLIKYFKKELAVFITLAPQGNINHFDFSNPAPQSGYNITKKIADNYFNTLVKSLRDTRTVELLPLKSFLKTIKIRSRESNLIAPPVPPGDFGGENSRFESTNGKNNIEYKKDKKINGLIKSQENILNIYELKKAIGKLTAEDLAIGSKPVLLMFSYFKNLFEKSKPEYYNVPIQILKLGDVVFTAIPGEPFVEIGLELKKRSDKNLLFPVSLANGYFGYIPIKESFKRGGYETQPHPWNCLSVDASKVIVEKLTNLLGKEINL